LAASSWCKNRTVHNIQETMKQAIVIVLAAALASGVALPFANVSQSHAAQATKPDVATVVSINNASRAHIAAAPQRVGRPVAASVIQPRKTDVKSAAAAAPSVRSQQRRSASTAVLATSSLNAKLNMHKQVSKPLLPIGEGAYQSAEAVAQRTLDSDRDCEKGRWNGCLHKDKADIVDGHSYGNLRGGANSANSANGGANSADAANGGNGGANSTSSGHGGSSGGAGQSPGSAGASDENGSSSAGKGSTGKASAEKGSGAQGSQGSAGKGSAEKDSATSCFKGLALTTIFLSLSATAHS